MNYLTQTAYTIALSENVLIQTALYSIPFVNNITRIFQRSQCIEILQSRKELNPSSFEYQQKQFITGRKYGSCIQVIAYIAIRCFCPTLSHIEMLFMATPLSLFFYNLMSNLPNQYEGPEGVFEGF